MQIEIRRRPASSIVIDAEHPLGGSVDNACPNRNGSCLTVGEALPLACSIDDDGAPRCNSMGNDMEIQSVPIELPSATVTIGRLKIAGQGRYGRIPDPLTKVAEHDEVGVRCDEVVNKRSVIVNGPQPVQQGAFALAKFATGLAERRQH